MQLNINLHERGAILVAKMIAKEELRESPGEKMPNKASFQAPLLTVLRAQRSEWQTHINIANLRTRDNRPRRMQEAWNGCSHYRSINPCRNVSLQIRVTFGKIASC